MALCAAARRRCALVYSLAAGHRAATAAAAAQCLVLVRAPPRQITRTATDLIFQQVGLCIDTAANGEEAVLMLNRREYDLLVLDVHLPQMSGYALCSWYKGMCRTQGQKTGYVVAVTANPDPQACAEFGIDTCLPKPLSTTYLVDALRGFWRSQGMPEGSPPQPYVAYGDVPPASCDTRIERAPSAAHGGNP